MKRRMLWALAAVFIIVGATLTFTPSRTETVRIGDLSLRVEVADTYDKRIRGLSGTEKLAEGSGMLFVFEYADRHGIWMKDMNYPLDILWLDDAKNVIHIEKYVTPESYPEAFASDSPAKYVLEVPSGTADKYGLKEGISATF